MQRRSVLLNDIRHLRSEMFYKVFLQCRTGTCFCTFSMYGLSSEMAHLQKRLAKRSKFLKKSVWVWQYAWLAFRNCIGSRFDSYQCQCSGRAQCIDFSGLQQVTVGYNWLHSDGMWYLQFRWLYINFRFEIECLPAPYWRQLWASNLNTNM